MRNVDRTVKDLQAQIDRREKSVTILSEDLSKSRDKVERLLQTIDELQASDSSSQLTAKRAERELESFRGGSSGGLRGSVARSERVAALSDYGGGSRRASSVRPPSVVGDVKIEVPQRQSSLMKGFL